MPTVRPDVLELVRAHGADTLSFFKLRDDIEHLFSADHRAMLGYGVSSGVLLVAGDPVGEAGALPGLLEEARALARRRRLRLGVLGASGVMRPVLSGAGLRC